MRLPPEFRAHSQRGKVLWGPTEEKGQEQAEEQGGGACARSSTTCRSGPAPNTRQNEVKRALPGQGPVVFILWTHASEPVDIQLWEEQEAVDQEPEEENEIHHIRLLHKLGQGVARGALAAQGHGFSGIVGLPG